MSPYYAFVRMHLSERTGDLTRDETLDELRVAVAGEDMLEQKLKALEHDPEALEQAALLYLGHAWDDDAQSRRFKPPSSTRRRVCSKSSSCYTVRQMRLPCRVELQRTS